MLRPRSPENVPPLVRFIPLFCANVIPLYGVIQLGWQPDMLILLYVVELLFVLLLAGVKALFAAQPPKEEESDLVTVSNATLSDTRGSVTAVSWLPPIYPRNIPFALGVVQHILWLAVAFTIILSTVIEPLGVLQQPAFWAAIVGILIGHLGETATQYFGARDYERVSVYGVLEPPARHGFLLVMLLVVLGGLLETGFGGLIALAILVGVKILTDWATYQTEAVTEMGRFRGWLAGPGMRDSAVDPTTPVSIPDGELTARIPANQRAVLLTAVFRSIPKSLQKHLPLAGMAWIVVLITVGEALSALQFQLITLGLIAGALVFGTVIETVRWYVRYGGMEYQRRGDHLVAFDRFFETPQWVTPINEIRNVEVASDRLSDRLTETRTFSMTSGWSDDDADRTIGPTAAPEQAVETFALPIATTEVEPIRRIRAAVSLFIPLGALAGTLVVIGRPSPPIQALLFLFFAYPAVVAVSQTMWKGAYS